MRAVDKVHVSEDVTHGVGFRDIGRSFADHDGEFRLTLEDGRGHVGEDHRITRSNHGAGTLVEAVDRRRRGKGAVFHIVHGHAFDLARTR